MCSYVFISHLLNVARINAAPGEVTPLLYLEMETGWLYSLGSVVAVADCIKIVVVNCLGTEKERSASICCIRFAISIMSVKFAWCRGPPRVISHLPRRGVLYCRAHLPVAGPCNKWGGHGGRWYGLFYWFLVR